LEERGVFGLEDILVLRIVPLPRLVGEEGRDSTGFFAAIPPDDAAREVRRFRALSLASFSLISLSIWSSGVSPGLGIESLA